MEVLPPGGHLRPGPRVEVRRSMLRAFAPYAAITLIPVLLLGTALAFSYRAQARARGVARGEAEARLVAQTAVEPVLDWHPLGPTMPPAVRADLQRLAARAVHDRTILRLRIRNLGGQVIYSDDGSGFATRPEDEALDAARGAVVARLTRLNVDTNDTGAGGVPAVEVYQPLTAGRPARPVGVLELYLPYGPIQRDVTAGLHAMYLDLAVGLVALYLALLGVSASVTRRLRRQVALNAFLAEHDSLTELPNRVSFHRRVSGALSRPRRRREPVAVALVDLDRFKAVNDTLGHHNGDLLLQEVARRLAAETRDGDTVARLGGDEFGIVLRNAIDPDGTLCRLRGVIEREIDVNGLPLSVEASVGYAVAPADGADVDELIQRADVALYHAKEHHLGVSRYQADQNHYDAASLGLIAELRHAIDEGQLLLHYQPKRRLSDGAVEAVEALVRWQHPEHGLLFPDRFLPLVEQTDLIDRLTEWVLERALSDLGVLPVGGLSVAVNISARNLTSPYFVERIREIVGRAEVPPGRVIVELTETSLLVDPCRAGEALSELAASGIRVSLDDFGKGQTSLGYLSALPLDEIKIDRGFVADMLTNPAHAAIVRSIVDLGHNLSLQVVGEGVESEEIGRQLREVGCDVAQGWLYARPMPLVELAEWLGRPAARASAEPGRAPADSLLS